MQDAAAKTTTEAEATRNSAAHATAQAEAFAQAEAVLAREAAEEATRLNQLVALADAAIANAETVESPPIGYIPASHELQTVGRLGVLSLNAIARKDDIKRYNLYVSVSIPRQTATGVHFSAKSQKVTIRCADATPAEQQVAADTEARRLVWKLLRPALPREIKQRKRKPENAQASERETRPKAASTAQQHIPAGKTRLPGPGRSVSRVASGVSCGLGHGTPAKHSARYCPLERAEYITAASVQAAMLQRQVRPHPQPRGRGPVCVACKPRWPDGPYCAQPSPIMDGCLRAYSTPIGRCAILN